MDTTGTNHFCWRQETTVLLSSLPRCRGGHRTFAPPGSRSAASTVSERRATTAFKAAMSVSGSSARRIGSAAIMCAKHVRHLQA